MKRITAFLTALLLAACLLSGCANNNTASTADTTTATTAATTAAQAEQATEAKQLTAYAEVDCSDILANYDLLRENLKSEEYVPQSGYILEKTEYSAADGETAFDMLLKTLEANSIAIDYVSAQESAYGSAYIKGINNIYEGDCGENSGWLYYVNGESPTTGCDQYVLNDGDVVTFKYICDYTQM